MKRYEILDNEMATEIRGTAARSVQEFHWCVSATLQHQFCRAMRERDTVAVAG
jgi:hypothetical protein